jgi:hypothetical protein
MAEPKFEPIAKMSMKKMGCDAKEAIKQDRAVFMARIYGEAASIKTKENRSGDVYSYLVGSFRAQTFEGNAFESEILYLPGTLMEVIEAQLKSADGGAVQFGWDIFSTPDRETTIGYKYAAKTVVKPEVSERLAQLTRDVQDKPLPTDSEPAKSKKK